MGVVLFGLLALSAAIIPGLLKARVNRERIQTKLDLQMLTLSARVYAYDNGGTLPDANKWCDQMVLVVRTNKEPPLDPLTLERLLSRKGRGYASNSTVAGHKLETLSSNDIVFLPVIKKGRNLTASLQDMEALAWDEKGLLEVVELSNSTRKLERVNPDR